MIPPGLNWLRGNKTGQTWLDELPAIVETCAKQWSLRIGKPYEGSSTSLVLPAIQGGTDTVVLKIQFPHWESTHEGAALACWNGSGAVRLLEHDDDHHALLIESCSPGGHLAKQEPKYALGVMINLLPQLWKRASGPFESLATQVDRWLNELPQNYSRARKPFESILLDEAIEVLTSLAVSQGEQVLIHQDLHGNNVLNAERATWLVIDPKPLIGEREFALAPIIRSREFGHGKEHVIGRLDRLSYELGLNRERARGWALGQTIAWAFDNDHIQPHHLETARWLFEAP